MKNAILALLALGLALPVFAASHRMTATARISLSYPDLGATEYDVVRSIAVGDVDGDGWLDLASSFEVIDAASNTLEPGRVRIAFGPLSRSTAFGSTVSLVLPVGLQSVKLADLNADGRADVIAMTDNYASFSSPGSESHSLGVYLRNPDGSFTPRADYSIPVGTTPATLLPFVAADADGDGDVDVFISRETPDEPYLLKNDGAGGLTLVALSPFVLPSSSTTAIFGDFDGDGDAEAVVCGTSGIAGATYQRNPDGSYSMNSSPTLSGSSFSAIDIDGDMDIDLFNGVSLLRDDGFPTFVADMDPSLLPSSSTLAFAADFDGDTLIDIATNLLSTGSAPVGTTVKYGQSAVSPRWAMPERFAIDVRGALTADVDNDGISELLKFDASDRSVTPISLHTSINAPPSVLAVTPTVLGGYATAVLLFRLEASDLDGHAVTWRIVTPPTKGQMNPINQSTNSSPQATVRYIADAGATGSDSFSVVANDGFADSTAMIVSVSLPSVPPASGGGGAADLWMLAALVWLGIAQRHGRGNLRCSL